MGASRTLFACATAALFTAYGGSARALISTPSYGADEIIIIGFLDNYNAVSIAGGPGAAGLWACNFDPSTGGTIWTDINPNYNTNFMQDNVVVNGGPGRDVLEIIYTQHTIPSSANIGNCDNRTWQPPNFGSRYLDINGGGSNDALFDSYGYTYSDGESTTDPFPGYDRIHTFSWNTNSRSRGREGSDLLMHNSIFHNRVSLYGEGDTDYIYDSDNPRAYWIDCGAGSDCVYGTAGDVNCENNNHTGPHCSPAGAFVGPPQTPRYDGFWNPE